jgi:nucleolar protein 56
MPGHNSLSLPAYHHCVILATRWFGTFLLNGKRVVSKKLFPKDAEAIASRLAIIQSGSILEEEQELASGHRVEVTESRLTKFGRLTEADLSFLRAEDYGYSSSLLRQVLSIMGTQRMKKSVDVSTHLIEAVHALDEVQSSLNSLRVRVRSWYSLHFPELSDHLNQNDLLNAIAEQRSREEMIRELRLQESIGTELIGGEASVLSSLAASVLELQKIERSLREFIEENAARSMPNLSALAGGLLAARLVASAGGLSRLSRLPSGTVQLLGAEKALFRHLRQHKKPPKHGLILQHPLVQSAPAGERGSIARHLASKISIAARLDYYGGADMGPELREEVERFAGKKDN